MDGEAWCDDIDDDFLAQLDQVDSTQSQPAAVPSGTKSSSTHGTQTMQQLPDAQLELVLDDLSDAFSSDEALTLGPAPSAAAASNGPKPRAGLNRSSSTSYRQTTLWGGQISQDPPRQSQAPRAGVYSLETQREEPTHHELDKEAMKTWVYPTNLGAIRDYQYSIVKSSLFHNTLVALPTGLGKTFIAATVMLNFYRWTKTAKIVFVAPTKPLVAQQIAACYNIAGIPRTDTTLLTGDIQPVLRVDEWAKRRVFFMTPQTLLNDLSHGYADPKSIVLLVIDEAHRAVGEYAYAKAAKLIRRFSNSMRVLALTATPGAKVETVQEVIDNLGISHCEIRTEESIDIRQYVHHRNIDQTVLDPSDEMNQVSELFTKALKPLTDKLSAQNIWYGRNPTAITTYGLIQAQKEWFATRGRQANQGVQHMMRAVFSVLTGIAHSIKLLNFHGIQPFYDNMDDLRREQESKGGKGSKYRRQLIEDSNFQEMMHMISGWLKKGDFIGHPKLSALTDCILNHFMDHGDSTRVIVFSEFRDSAESIVRLLNTHRPLIKASVFVGQADGKRGEGMKQAQQIQTIEQFRNGVFNVLVATSIGEEGLDIGQVDLIVCYDASASPIRMLQRMGRTGRKRAGNIVLLLMRGKEEDQFAKSKDNYEKMQQLICEGSRLNFRYDLSRRIIPWEVRPEVDKRHIDIPIENTQDQSLPEPKKRRAPAGKKKPPKKFHMPDGVTTGFTTVKDLLNPGQASRKPKQQRNPELDDVVEIPSIKSVALKPDELKELNRSYRDLPFNHSVVEETDMPCLTAYPELQRELRPVVGLKHGRQTKRWVKLFRTMSTSPDDLVRAVSGTELGNIEDIALPAFIATDGESESIDENGGTSGRKRQSGEAGRLAKPKSKKRKFTATPADMRHDESDIGGFPHEISEDEASHSTGKGQPKRKRGKASKGKSQRKGKRGGRGINSDEIGDDCERESDAMETDGSDDGADLVDFLVSDNHVSSSIPDPTSTFSTLASPVTPKAVEGKPFFVPTEFPGTQDSDGVPDLDNLLSAGKKKSTGAPSRTARARRQVVDDSDSDE
ncbi:hypothetical protein S40293_05811 [Stachybotrys chartarum IBT 40293]|nr:hypothetical protein S40293_05811 [Stachybotrys chartarum IBT 40293]